jgi:hypothetical protein
METLLIRLFTTVAAALALTVPAQVQQPAPTDTLVSAIAQEAGLPLVTNGLTHHVGEVWI